MNRATDAINKTLEELYFEYWPHEINNGNCDSFAHDVCKLVPKAWEVWAEDWYEMNGITPPETLCLNHCFIVYRKRFFDSECPEGVKDFRDLPFFKNQKKASK